MNVGWAPPRQSSLLLIWLVSAPAIAGTASYTGGHAKAQFLLNSFPEDSVFLETLDSPAKDLNGDFRLKFDWNAGRVSLNADYQLIARRGDSIALAKDLSEVVTLPNPVSSDDRRLFDLTKQISEGDDSAVVHRLDRLYADVITTRAVARLGRQAVSWGNGLIYTPLDFFNPFDPAAVDKEYKTGDDMLYGQFLRNNGDDLQAVWVLRRDSEGEVSDKVDSVAAKYHGFAGEVEYDLLLSEHYEDTILGVGGLSNIGGAIWRGDITFTETQTDTVTSLVSSLSYSWVSWHHNFSGIVEYFYNGFGQSDGDYSPSALAANPDLLDRYIRGELFTLAQHYLATSVLIEASPLWLLTPNIFVNASDGSALIQLVSSYDFKQDWQFLAALSVPVGPPGTEFGGLESGVEGRPFSTELNIFAQLAWYF
jgi:hypothetical protein